ncbi:MAG: sulfatase-like hydrolase/transferase, partial [Kiritimatiellae bacterium]|nr:sulfatase-like hydrolase/transferase [Kiritimatiellia bacterium]
RKHKWTLPERFHMNAWIAERTNALLKGYAARGESFFLWASFLDPHPPYLVPEPWDEMYSPSAISVPTLYPGEHDNNPPHFQKTQQRDPDFSMYKEPGGAGCHGFHSHLQDRTELAKDIAVYYGMISCMDKYIGQILDQLARLGLTENTLVVFTSDHGHFFGQHGLIAKGPFHYEDMIRVPFVISLPGKVPCGCRCDALLSLVDLPKTFLSLCGLPVPPDMTGVDQRDVWFGTQAAARTEVIVENRHQPTTIHVRTMVEHRYKITVYCDRQYGELFDLKNDPGEVENRWSDPAWQRIKQQLIERLLLAEMAKEEPLDPKKLTLCHKSPAMYAKSWRENNLEIRVDPQQDLFELFDHSSDPGCARNLWEEPMARTLRARMCLALLFARLRAEPIWMPRVWGA